MDALVEAHLVSSLDDFFTLTKDDFLTLEGFKEKSADNAIASIDAVRTVPFSRLLVALSIDHIGATMAKLITRTYTTPEALRNASIEDFIRIDGVGEIVAKSLYEWLRTPKNRQLLERLLAHVTCTVDTKAGGTLQGKTFVFTGTMKKYSRDEAGALIEARGGVVQSTVSSKTDYLVVGENAGSKAEKANALTVKILGELAFLALIKAS